MDAPPLAAAPQASGPSDEKSGQHHPREGHCYWKGEPQWFGKGWGVRAVFEGCVNPGSHTVTKHRRSGSLNSKCIYYLTCGGWESVINMLTRFIFSSLVLIWSCLSSQSSLGCRGPTVLLQWHQLLWFRDPCDLSWTQMPLQSPCLQILSHSAVSVSGFLRGDFWVGNSLSIPKQG